MTNPSPATRRRIYRIAQAVAPLLVFYGILTEAALPLWLALVSAVLVPELAARNVPDDELWVD